MTNRLFSVLDKAPFAGKYSIRGSISKYIEADIETEKKQYLKTSTYLGVMAVAHAYQSYLGYQAGAYHMEHLQNTGDAIDSLFIGADAVYAGVNATVTARQAALMKRVREIRQKKLAKHEPDTLGTDSGEKKSFSRKLSQKGILGTAALTLAGQAIFTGVYFDGIAKEDVNSCIEVAAKVYTDYQEQNPDIALVPLKEFTQDVCS